MQVTGEESVGVYDGRGRESEVGDGPTAYFFAGGRAKWPSVKLCE
jgi:hypothetical protein